MVRWCIRLTRLTLVCEVIRYRLVQVRQNQKKNFRVGGPQSPFSISSSFILSFVLLPFFLNTKMNFSSRPTFGDVASAAGHDIGGRNAIEFF